MSIRSILRNKKRGKPIVPSPYTRGTTLNKLANRIVSRIHLTGESFKDAYKHLSSISDFWPHNQGEFRRYPPDGKPGSLESLLKLAVGKKIGTVIK